jgi:serine/threonine protein kinase
MDSTKEKRRATVADPGWRAKEKSSGRQATVVDTGWRNQVGDMLDPTNVMNQATANAFATIEEFQEAVSKLSELVSTTNQTYAVKSVLSCKGGESVILLCTAPDGTDVVAKVYYEPVNSAGSSISARTRVLDYMRTEEGQKYTLAVNEIGLVTFDRSRYYFEIMPYCPEGDLSKEKPLSFAQIVKLTRILNEALHSIHKADILHRDIKPENLYHKDGTVVIGDFGVARLVKAGVTRHTVGTDRYRAPETVLAVTADDTAFYFDEKCDYYSLGVTLGTLFEGHQVFDGLDGGMVTLAIRNGRLPLTREDKNRDKLENLLNGLCRFDSRYRFGYEDVKKWLADHNYTGGVLDEEWPRPFRMLNEEYRDEKSLFFGITKDEAHWKEGLDLLYGKFFENFFISFRTDLARAAQVADELYRTKDADKGLAVFLKNLYAPGPIVWRGYTFQGLEDLGSRMAKTALPGNYAKLLQNGYISHWLKNTEGIKCGESTVKLVAKMEQAAEKEPELACYWFGNSFAKEKYLFLCGTEVSGLEELFPALFGNACDFYTNNGLEKLMDRKAGSDLYGFLFSYGYRPMIDHVWDTIGKMDKFYQAHALFGMMESIAVKAHCDADVIRSFYVNYGPIGGAVYTQRLIADGGDAVYMPLDANGKRILSAIREFHTDGGDSIQMLYQKYSPLIDKVEELRKILMDNPYRVSSGIYEKKGVICTNLKGSFAFELYGRLAPLGYHARITDNGGQ